MVFWPLLGTCSILDVFIFSVPSAPLFSTNTSSVPTPTAQGITSLHSLHTGIPPPHPVNPATVHPGNPGITPFPTIQPPGPAPAVQPIQAPRQSTPLQPVMGIFNAGKFLCDVLCVLYYL